MLINTIKESNSDNNKPVFIFKEINQKLTSINEYICTEYRYIIPTKQSKFAVSI